MEDTKKQAIEPKLGDSIPDQWTKQAEAELRNKTRVTVMDQFRGEKKVELHIHQPTSGDDSKATDAYTRVFNRHLRDPDLMMRDELLRILESRGIWGKKQEEEVDDLREDMRVVELKVAKMRQSGKFKQEVLNQYREIWTAKREELSTMFGKKSGYLSNSVEGRAEEEEIKAKLSLCVKFPDGKYVWSSIDELNKESDRIVVTRLVNECMLFLMLLSSALFWNTNCYFVYVTRKFGIFCIFKY